MNPFQSNTFASNPFRSYPLAGTASISVVRVSSGQGYELVGVLTFRDPRELFEEGLTEEQEERVEVMLTALLVLVLGESLGR